MYSDILPPNMHLPHLDKLGLAPWYFHRLYLETLRDLSLEVNSLKTLHKSLQSFLANHPQEFIFDQNQVWENFESLSHKPSLLEEERDQVIDNAHNLSNIWTKKTQKKMFLSEYLSLWNEFHTLLNPLHFYLIEENEEITISFRLSHWDQSPPIIHQVEWLYFLCSLKRAEVLPKRPHDYDLEKRQLSFEKSDLNQLVFKSSEYEPFKSSEESYSLEDSKKWLTKGKHELLTSVYLNRKEEIASQVIKIIEHSNLTLSLSIEEVSKQMSLSKRTLQRKLEREGIQFNDLKRTVRRLRAHQLLTMSERSMTEISYELGFSEPAAFNKFFKDWTGYSPMNYRKKEI